MTYSQNDIALINKISSIFQYILSFSLKIDLIGFILDTYPAFVEGTLETVKIESILMIPQYTIPLQNNLVNLNFSFDTHIEFWN